MTMTYVDLEGQVYPLIHLDAAERKLLGKLQRKASSGLSWDEFDNFWLPQVAAFYHRRGFRRRTTSQTMLFKIGLDLSSRIGVAAGLTRLSDYRDELEEIIRTRFKTQAKFSKATGLSPDTVNNVLAGRKHLAIDTLEAALDRIGYTLHIVQRPEIALPHRQKARA